MMEPACTFLPGADRSRWEWLEADGLGGFASGTVGGLRTRRYHALLLTATTPPIGRFVLVNGFDAWVETGAGRFMLTSQCYGPGVVAGEGGQYLEAFDAEPWPHWIFKLPDGSRIQFDLFVRKGRPATCLSWKLLGPRRSVKLWVRPFLSGRDYHALHQSNPAFQFAAAVEPDRVCWRTYPDVPGVTALHNGAYAADPHWYHHFHYDAERARGLDSDEDLAAPGVFSWNLADQPAALILAATPWAAAALPARVRPLEIYHEWKEAERDRRTAFPSALHRAADAYLVERHANTGMPGGEMKLAKTIVAGYPWFTDWGRDTFIALRGLGLATGRLDESRAILETWAGAVSEGMLPNRFPDRGERPEFNSVDASLWYVIAVHEYLEAAGRRGGRPHSGEPRLLAAVDAILEGYSRGTRFGIRAEADGLLACGEPGTQLTWMDAKVGDWVVTPRVGKPVEVQALWLNALWIGSRHQARWREPFARGLASFQRRFWNAQRNMLFDVIDVNHQAGVNDATFRPNQIFAVGGLPIRLFDDNRAFLIVDAVKNHLWTPLGLRSSAPGEPGYVGRYQGDVRARDGAYHQGTVWPWLIGAYADAWTRVHQRTPAALGEARRVCLQPLLDFARGPGLGHLPEIADGDEPQIARGCPWQAWSLGEALWLDQVVLAVPPPQPLDRAPAHVASPGRRGEPAAPRRANAEGRPVRHRRRTGEAVIS